MSSILYEKHNYTAPITMIRNVRITEYDMKEGGYSILREGNYLSDSEFKMLEQMTKKDRTIKIGKMIKEKPQIGRQLMEGFIEARQAFFECNDIQDGDIISIKKDAIFTTKPCKETKFGNYIEFRPKNSYIFYVNIQGKEIYYDPMKDIIDVKGYNKEAVDFHKDYLMKDCKKIFNKIINGTTSYIDDLIYLKSEFTEFELPKEYYKDLVFNSYIINTYNDNLMEIDNIDNDMLKYCVHNNNLNFILGLLAVLI